MNTFTLSTHCIAVMTDGKMMLILSISNETINTDMMVEKKNAVKTQIEMTNN